MIRYLDVCSGYSAFTLAAQGLPFQCAGYSEIEAFPRAILEQRHDAVPVDWDHRWAPHPNTTPLFGDFTKIEPHHVGPVDLLIGGTPCQAFSVAGKRLGLDDPRGNLTLEFLALARRLRVPWLAWENVPGFLSHDEGRTMGAFLRLLGECGYGYAYRVLDAQFIRVDGHERAVPQRRRRVFVIGHIGDAAGPAAILFEPESLRGDPAPRRETRQDIAPTISARANGGGGLGTDSDVGGGLIANPPVAFGGNNTGGAIDTATALNSHGGPHGRLDFESETFIAQVAATLPAGGNATGGDRQPGTGAETASTMLVAHPYRVTPNDGAYSTGDVTASLTTGTDSSAVTLLEATCIHADALGRSGDARSPSIDAAGRARLRDAGMGISEGSAFGLTTGQPHAVAYAIQAGALRENPESGPDGIGVQQDGAYTLEARAEVQAVAFSITPSNSNKDYNTRPTDKAQALSTGSGQPSARGGDFVVQHWAVRRLTPVECERLMGVPDGFTRITYRGRPAADGPIYKVLGNSQARNNMRWLAHGLAWVITARKAAA